MIRRRIGAVGAVLALLLAPTLTGCGAVRDTVSQLIGRTASAPDDTATDIPSSAPTSDLPSSAASSPRGAASAIDRAEGYQAAGNPCTENHKRKAVLVRLSVQHMWLCEHGTAVYDSAVTSGKLGDDSQTPTGHYKIQGLNKNSVLHPSSGETYSVKYWIPFDAPSYGFHDSSWQQFPYGSAQYKTDGSHGCVHLPLAAIRHLYRWAEMGTAVRIGD